MGFASGTVAAELGLTQASFALNSSPGGASQSASVFMNNLVQTEYSQFGSFQATWQTLAELDPNISGRSRRLGSVDWGSLYLLESVDSQHTPPAGSSLPTTDPAGTYSGPGASAPTIDPPGTYSLAGASAPTLDPPGTYSLAGASEPTLDPPGAGAFARQSDTAFMPIDKTDFGLYNDFSFEGGTEARGYSHYAYGRSYIT